MSSDNNNNDDDDETCQKCLKGEHTRVECKKIKKREYMRQYMHKYNENRVSYRRWAFVPREL